MAYKKIKLLFVICTILLLFNMVGCESKVAKNKLDNSKPSSTSENIPAKTDGNATNKPITTPQENKLQPTMSTSETESENKKVIKDKLLSEFKDYLKKVQSGDKSEYNLIMASDRAYGLINKFSLTEEENEFVQSNYMEVRVPLKYSVVYNGYSSDGVHFIAIISPTQKENDTFKDAISQIRGKDDEYLFLSNIPQELSPARTLYMGLDIYAEDLLGVKKEIKIDNIIVSNRDGSEKKIVSYFDDEDFKKYLSKYNRATNDKKLFDDKKWYSFIFDGTLIYQPTIFIDYNNEHICLEK